jgi:hypothetical protein
LNRLITLWQKNLVYLTKALIQGGFIVRCSGLFQTPVTGRPGLERDPRNILSGPGIEFKSDYPCGALAESLGRAGVAVKLA